MIFGRPPRPSSGGTRAPVGRFERGYATTVSPLGCRISCFPLHVAINGHEVAANPMKLLGSLGWWFRDSQQSVDSHCFSGIPGSGDPVRSRRHPGSAGGPGGGGPDLLHLPCLRSAGKQPGERWLAHLPSRIDRIWPDQVFRGRLLVIPQVQPVISMSIGQK